MLNQNSRNHISNLIDKPRAEGAADLLGVDKYVDALVEFIRNCEMPTTIGIQGEWGSGKTSLLNQIRWKLCEMSTDTPEQIKQKPYYGIWLNTWQYSLMKTKEEALISIISGLTQEILNIIKKKHGNKTQETVKQVTGIFGKILKTTAKAAVNAAGLDGEEFIKAFEGENNATILSFRNSLSNAINQCLEEDKKQGNINRGFIFFIDDLDRIDPPAAVEVLELLKNIFEVENCIFILAIDYEVVVKGLIPKFGPLTEKNEREFRSFFDKIIQLPFTMPVSSYDVSNFLIDALKRIGYITGAEQDLELLDELVKKSVGTNPRSLKRLINTLSLIKIVNSKVEDIFTNEPYEMLINFGLVCIQIAYPKLYEFLVQEPNFLDWDEEIAKKYNLKEIPENEQSTLSQSELFDEEWEKTLYRFCQKDIYLKSKAFQISEMLNTMRSILEKNNKDIGTEISKILTMSAVTSVNITNTPPLKQGTKLIRFETIEGVMQLLLKNGYSKNFVDSIKILHDRVYEATNGLTEFSYGPSTLTFSTTRGIISRKVVYSYNYYVRKKNIEALMIMYPWGWASGVAVEDLFINAEKYKLRRIPGIAKYVGRTFWGKFQFCSIDDIRIFNHEKQEFEKNIITLEELIETVKSAFNDLTKPEFHVPLKELDIWNDKRYFPPIIPLKD